MSVCVPWFLYLKIDRLGCRLLSSATNTQSAVIISLRDMLSDSLFIVKVFALISHADQIGSMRHVAPLSSFVFCRVF